MRCVLIGASASALCLYIFSNSTIMQLSGHNKRLAGVPTTRCPNCYSPRKFIEATIYVIDCFDNIEEKLQLLSKLYSMKFFDQTFDIQRIIICNRPNTSEIRVINKWLLYELDIIKNVKKSVKCDTKENSTSFDLLDVLEISLNFFEEELILQQNVKRIVLISDLNTPINNQDVDIEYVKSNLKENNIWLYVIGPNVNVPRIKCQQDIMKLCHALPEQFTLVQKENFSILKAVAENCIFADMENGLDLIFSHKIEVKAPFFWYVDMSVGNDIKIPVCVSKIVKAHNPIKFTSVRLNPDEIATPKKTWFDVNTHEEIPDEDVAGCYSFHNKYAVFTDDQEREMAVKDFQKCLSIFAFTGADEISELYFLPDSMSLIKADTRELNDSENEGFQLFVQGLRFKNVVALAKYVYDNGNAPNLFCIFPCPDHCKSSCLLMAKLAYSHEFCERFERGRLYKREKSSENDEIKMFTYGLLDAMTDGSNNANRLLHPLCEHLKLCRNRVRQCEYLFMQNDKQKSVEAPALCPHPELVKTATKYGDLLAEAFEKKTD